MFFRPWLVKKKEKTLLLGNIKVACQNRSSNNWKRLLLGFLKSMKKNLSDAWQAWRGSTVFEGAGIAGTPLECDHHLCIVNCAVRTLPASSVAVALHAYEAFTGTQGIAALDPCCSSERAKLAVTEVEFDADPVMLEVVKNRYWCDLQVWELPIDLGTTRMWLQACRKLQFQWLLVFAVTDAPDA